MTDTETFPYRGIPVEALGPEELAEAIAFHNKRYYVQAQPLVSDALYDRMLERLRALRPDHPILEQVGAPVDEEGGELAGADKVEHRTPMLSLEKCYAPEELARWARQAPDVPLTATPKVDGLACSLVYDRQGRLRVGATRGDGVRGENVSGNVRQLPSIVERLPSDVTGGAELEVRGEIFLPLSVFAGFAGQFANPRNLAAGTLKAKDETAVPLSSLRFLAYDLLGLPARTERDKSDLLRRLGFEPAPQRTCAQGEAAATFDAFLAERDQLDYEVDGVVFRFDDVPTQQRLGTTGHHPRGAIAWKFPTDAGLTTLQEIEWSVSRTGTITPVAIVAPVQLSGATVTRATLHNLSNLERLGLRLGDRVELVRRGGVIPHVEAGHGGGQGDVAVPTVCPACEGPTRVVETERKSGDTVVRTKVLVCSEPETCVTARARQLRHFCDELEMKGFGEKVIDVLLERNLVGDPADLYTLQAGDLEQLPNFGQLSADKLIREIDKARTVELPAFLRSLGIPSLGRHASDLVASRWDLDALRQVPVEELAALHSIGALTAKSIAEGLQQKAALVDRLLQHVRVVRPTRQAGEAGGPMAGETVVFTGSLQHMTRRDAQQLVARLGGTAGSSVTQDTTLLVVADDEWEAEAGSSKLQKARKLADKGHPIRIVRERDFLALVGRSEAS